jgi:uncharacterized protein
MLFVSVQGPYMVRVELVYIASDQSLVHLNLSLAPCATVEDALHQSGLLITNPEIVNLPVGIFAKQVTLQTRLKPGDRIEIYRPLTLDPKEKRRQRTLGQRLYTC